ncbi:hypothetical protein [uncultured Paludibaculum sp.]|uniref:hypothetical protein n=1 Tax=uncultured Paludibaculum sp. TaxID=1765020 RepID=UPI002AAC03C3|nr:hypothetical protein [uncultured Paludibaculum sp.]
MGSLFRAGLFLLLSGTLLLWLLPLLLLAAGLLLLLSAPLFLLSPLRRRLGLLLGMLRRATLSSLL